LQSFLEKDNFIDKFANNNNNLDYAWKNFQKKFTIIFNFLGGRPKLAHAFSHSCLPCLKCFYQIMQFCKSPWVALINTYLKLLQKFHMLLHIGTILKMHDQNKYPENFLPNPTHHNLQLILKL